MFIRRQGSQVEILTPAKLNLFLEILARREDGFHELETLMQAITIYDSLSIFANSDGELKLTCEWSAGLKAGDVAFGELPTTANNIVLKALERLRVRSGTKLGADIRLVKRIPAAAGLGGASSDAAAALVAGNEVWKLGWSLDQLANLAAEIGSDIPFFFGTGELGSGSAVCRGRGERIELITGLPTLNYVVVRPPVGLSTPQVYQRCRPAETPRPVAPLIEAVRRGDFAGIGRLLHNQLQPAAESLSPWIEKCRRAFERFDFVGHQMSGSGSSYFGICRNARQARRLTSLLRNADVGAVFCAATAPAVRVTEH